MATSTRLERGRPGADDRGGINLGLSGARRHRRRRQFSLVAAGVVLLGLSAAVFAALVPRTAQARAGVGGGEDDPGRPDDRCRRSAGGRGGVERVARRGGRVAGGGAGPGGGVGCGGRSAVGGGRCGRRPGPAAGDAIVGLALAPGRLPAGLSVGDTVVVLSTAAAAGGVGSGAVATPGAAAVTAELARGRVFALSPSSDGSRVDVSLVVPSASADAAADAAAGGRVSVYWVTR